MARSISARCINSPMVLAACYSGTAAGLPPLVRRNRRITTPMDSTSAESTASSPPTSSTKVTTRRSRIEPLAGATESEFRRGNTSRPPTASIQSPHHRCHVIATNKHRIWHRDRNQAIMAAARYTWRPLRFFVGYEHIRRITRRTVGRWRLGPGRLFPERRRRQQSRFFPRLCRLVDGCEIRFEQAKPTSLWLGITRSRTTSVFHRPARPAAGFRASCAGDLNEGVALYSTITSPSVSTVLPELRILRERRSGHRHSSWPGVPTSYNTTLLRQSVLVSRSDRFPRRLSSRPS